jgi:hypothetical protein
MARTKTTSTRPSGVTRSQQGAENRDIFQDCLLHKVKVIRKSPCVEGALTPKLPRGAREGERGRVAEGGKGRGNPRVAKDRGPGKKPGFAYMSKKELCNYAARANCRVGAAGKRKRRVNFRQHSEDWANGSTTRSLSSAQIRQLQRQSTRSVSLSRDLPVRAYALRADLRDNIEEFQGLKDADFNDLTFVDIERYNALREKLIRKLERLRREKTNPRSNVRDIDEGIQALEAVLRGTSVGSMQDFAGELQEVMAESRPRSAEWAEDPAVRQYASPRDLSDILGRPSTSSSKNNT